LWSLGIEEQFYLVWPPVLFLLYRRLNVKTIWPILFVLCCSLAYNLWVSRIDIVADFYSPLSRFWELLVGGALAFYQLKNPTPSNSNRNAVAWLGISCLLGSFAVIRADMVFPGFLALLPTLGAAMTLFAGKQSWVNRKILATPILVWFGLISYPLYLWHWLLLATARIMFGETPPASARVGLATLSILFAWLTYALIERRIRFQSKSKITVPALCVLMVGIFLCGHLINKNHGIASRNHALLNADPGTMTNGADRSGLQRTCGLPPSQMPLFEWCANDGKPISKFAILGDSKAESLFFGLARESHTETGWRMLGAVTPVAGEKHPVNEVAYQSIENDAQIRVVVLTNALRGLFVLHKDSGFIDETKVGPSEIDTKVATYSSLVRRLERNGKRVVFTIDNPTLPDPNSCLSGGLTRYEFLNRFVFRKENPFCNLRYSDHLAGIRIYTVFLQKLKQENPGLVVYDPTSLLCNVQDDRCGFAEQRNFLYSYGDHISDYASSKIAKELLPIVYSLADLPK
jgi:SGNH domain (fused to AT3 domains)